MELIRRFKALYWGRFFFALMVFWPLLWSNVMFMLSWHEGPTTLGLIVFVVITLWSLAFCVVTPYMLLTKDWPEFRKYLGLPPIS